MSLCDPYQEIELYLDQIKNEIVNLEQSNEECESENVGLSAPQENGHPAGKSLQEKGSNPDPVLVHFDSIISDIQELLTRHKLRNQSKENEIYTNGTVQSPTNDSVDYSFDESYDSNSISVDLEGNLNEGGCNESTSPQTSTNLTRGSECSSSPCLTSPSDLEAVDEDSRSSSSVDGGPGNIWMQRRCWRQQELTGKSSSAPVLKKEIAKVKRQFRSQSDRHLSEIEATEACKWLRAAGFPQYAQMYEDMQFPVDVAAAAQDHPQLEPSVLHSLFRRLHALNRCARVHQQRPTHTDDSEDEQCALSDNWTYELDTRRWSRTYQTMQIPNLEDPANKERWRGSLPHPKDPPERLPESPKDKLRRAGSTKFRWRRDGVVMENRKDLLDSLTKQLSSLQADDPSSPSHTDSLNRQSKRRKTRSLDKADTATNSPNYLSESRAFWQNDRIDEGVVMSDEPNIPNEGVGRSIYTLSCTQLQVLRKLALLKLTAHIEKYCPTHRTGWNWDLPKFIRKMKNPGYREKTVFGVPLTVILQKNGLSIPKGIEEALHWMKQNANDQVGLFRKPGVRSRIQTLKGMVENGGDTLNFTEHQAYDIADMVKQFFRELPEVLLTSKLSETFILIFQHVPPHLRREAVLCTLLLMPDEHSEVLHVLLSFLSSIAKHADVNQMNESNLALCFAPSLFHHTQLPTCRQNLGSPHPNELAENKAAQECLYFLIKNCDNIFKIPRELMEQCNSAEMKESTPVPLSQLGVENNGDWRTYLHDCQVALLKEVKEKSRGWMIVPSHHPRVEISFKKVADGHPLRLWKVCVEIDATPTEILHRLLRERHIWDDELQSTRLVSQIEGNAEIFQFSRRNVHPLPLEDYCIVRGWKTDLGKGACLLVETSVEHSDALYIPSSVRGIILASRYYIEPCAASKSKLLHLSRMDTRGRMPEWYHKNFGHLVALQMFNLMKSFHPPTGSESKV